MRNYKQVVDLLQRRLGTLLQKDNIWRIYVDMEDNGPLDCVAIVKEDISTSDLTKISVKYQHMFSDMIDQVNITVYQRTQYYKPGKTVFPIYDERKGFNVCM